MRYPGCPVRDDGRPGPCNLYLDEHHLDPDTHEWLHPDEIEDNA